MSTYTDASLVFYPSGYKASKAYSLKPTDGSGDLDFTRASTATRVNESGLIESVATNVPRIDFTGAGCGKLLLEPQRTNLVTYSDQFDNAEWGKSGSPAPTVSANTTISPDGTQNADSLVMTSPSAATRLEQSVTFAAGTYTISLYVKSLSGISQVVRLFKYDGTSETNSGDIAVTTEWTRITYTFTSVVGSGNISIRSGASFNNVNIAIYGAQLELSSYSTSLIKTTTTAVTRVFDACDTLDITSFSIGNSYTILIGAELNPLENNKVFFTGKTSANTESFTIRNVVGQLRLYNTIDSSYPLTSYSSSTNKWVLKIDGTSYKIFYYGGSAASTFTTARNFGKFNFYGSLTELKMQNLIIFPSALTDAECIALTL